jgi:hypothetical protein
VFPVGALSEVGVYRGDRFGVCWPDLVGSGGFCGGFVVVVRSCSGGVGVEIQYSLGSLLHPTKVPLLT